MGDFISQKIQPRWLKLRDACTYSAMGKGRIKALAQEGQITGFPDPESARGDWIFDRLSLDAYRENQAGQGVIAEALVRVLT